MGCGLITGCGLVKGGHIRDIKSSLSLSVFYLLVWSFMLPQNKLSSQNGVPGRRRHVTSMDLLRLASEDLAVSC